jgi:hypothetical protein
MRPDTISLVPEGIMLLVGEQMAREKEAGDGTPQQKISDQLDLALISPQV